jgi:hypothetical protein
MRKPLSGPPFGPPLELWAGNDAGGVATPDGSALNQFAQQLFGATALPGIFLI